MRIEEKVGKNEKMKKKEKQKIRFIKNKPNRKHLCSLNFFEHWRW